jgi:hypothetical protein
MSKGKKNVVAEVKIDEKEPIVEETPTKKEYESLIATYKEQSPAKYEAKKAELEAKLKLL